MSIHTKLVANALFPLHEKLKGHSTMRVCREMEVNQWLSRQELQAIQLEHLRDFLSNIGKYVPYYRDMFAKLGFDPVSLDSAGGLEQLPLMGKAEIRANTEQLKATNAMGLQRFNTGGSSGEPLVFFLGSQRVSHDVAAKLRATRWWDVDIGDTEIVVWGSPIELDAQGRIRNIRDWLFRTELLSAFEMSEDNLDGFVARIRRKKPKMLFGYPSSLSLIAAHAQKTGQRLDDIGARVAFVTSERLYDYQREQIESVFGCPVANGYGGRDAGFIAHECPARSLHITCEDIVVEIVDGDGRVLPPGETGEIVVTHMATGDFPFVRYRTGDVGALGTKSCDCGRGLPILEKLEGRSTDFIVAQNGAMVHGLALIYVLRDIDEVQSFRIIQDSINQLRVQLLVTGTYSRDSEQLILDVFRQRLGETIEVDFEYMEEIPREKSGKFRYVISHVAN